MSQDYQNTNRETVGEWLSRPFEWRIPVYQRHYAWDPSEEFGPTHLFCEIVLEHALHRIKGKEVDPHYFGAILVENRTADDNIGSTKHFDVVDGQQRLTTISVALFAIIGAVSRLNCRAEIQDKLAEYIFLDPEQEYRKHPKLLPTNFDQTQFQNMRSMAFGEGADYKDDSEQAKKSKIVHACHFLKGEFEQFVKKHGETDELRPINALIDTILGGFELILISLKKTDSAQRVFETINNTGRPLSTFDLIRNNVFDRAENGSFGISGASDRLFRSDTWQEFEQVFWEGYPGREDKNKTNHIDSYIARMLMAKERKLILSSRDPLFKAYKKFAENEAGEGRDVKAEINTISEYVDVYKYLVGENNKNPINSDFRFGYFMHKVCKSLDFHPLLFVIAKCGVSSEEKQRMVVLLENFVIRRSVCGLSTGDYNKRAPEICGHLGEKPTYERLGEYLKETSGSSRFFPHDEEVITACVNENFYSNKLKVYVFDRIVHHITRENYDEKRDLKGLTIDHIMPQAWREKDGWRESLQPEIPEDVDRKINTIGNLTPMSKGLNSAKSNRDWLGEKGAQQHLKSCDLKLTRKLAEHENWGIEEIDARSRELAKLICEIWSRDC